MNTILWSTIALLLILLVAAARKLSKYEAAFKQKGMLRAWPIRKVGLEDFDPVFGTGPYGPTLDTEVRFIGAYKVLGGISNLETWILAVLAKRSHRIFEFGTCTGKTTYLLAANAPADARVVTLTLPPDSASGYQAETQDAAQDTRIALVESCNAEFLYNGTPEAAKITQIFADSKLFDEAPYRDNCDLVFVDGSHAYSFVKSDSEKALNMVRPGGIVLWHDYRGPRNTQGVYRALNELAQRLPLVHLAGTSLVAYRRPA